MVHESIFNYMQEICSVSSSTTSVYVYNHFLQYYICACIYNKTLGNRVKCSRILYYVTMVYGYAEESGGEKHDESLRHPCWVHDPQIRNQDLIFSDLMVIYGYFNVI